MKRAETSGIHLRHAIMNELRRMCEIISVSFQPLAIYDTVHQKNNFPAKLLVREKCDKRLAPRGRIHSNLVYFLHQEVKRGSWKSFVRY